MVIIQYLLIYVNSLLRPKVYCIIIRLNILDENLTRTIYDRYYYNIANINNMEASSKDIIVSGGIAK